MPSRIPQVSRTHSKEITSVFDVIPYQSILALGDFTWNVRPLQSASWKNCPASPADKNIIQHMQ